LGTPSAAAKNGVERRGEPGREPEGEGQQDPRATAEEEAAGRLGQGGDGVAKQLAARRDLRRAAHDVGRTAEPFRAERAVRGLPEGERQEPDGDAAAGDHWSSLRMRSYVSAKPSIT
jgi:hypothetical protein